MSASLTDNPISHTVNGSNRNNDGNPNNSQAIYSETSDSYPSRDRISASDDDDDDDNDYNDDIDDNDDNDNDDNNREESPLSLEELLYSASSFHAIARPVFVTMVLSSLSAVYVNNESTMEAGAKQFAEAYQVWSLDDSGDSTGKNLAMSIANTLVMVTVIAGMTFGIVLLYKFRCMKFLVGYMIMSSASLLGLLGNYMATIAISIYQIPIDVITYYSSLYNFAIVGIIAIFYQQGIPSGITQIYLVFTSVILAWHLSHFDDWTAWTLLVMLALYDLCAVLTPCGPLKALVNLMQEDDSPEMPGLLYEAELPKGTQRPGAAAANNNNNTTSAKRGDDEQQTSTSTAYSPPIALSDENDTTRRRHSTHDRATDNRKKNHKATTSLASSSSPLTDVVQISLPLAIAQIYKLKLVSDYGTSNPPSGDGSTRSRGRKRGKGGKGGTVVNPSPLLADWRRVDCSDSFYERKFSVEELTSIVRVEMSRNGGRIERRDGGDNREDDGDGQRSSDNGNGNDKEKEVSYAVLGRNGDVKRVLMLDRQGKVFEIIDDDDDDDDDNSEDESVDEGPASIRLGLVRLVSCPVSYLRYTCWTCALYYVHDNYY